MTSKAKPSKRHALPKALGLTVLGGALILGGPATLAGWHQSVAVGTETISTGTINQNISGSAWTLNGTPLGKDELGAVLLVPGDTVIYAGTSTPSISDRLHAEMKFIGVDGDLGDLANVPGVSMGWTVKGKQEALLLSSSDSGTPVSVGFTLALSPELDKSAMEGTVDLSLVQVVLEQVGAPEEPTEAPENVPEDPEGAWDIGDTVINTAIRNSLNMPPENPLLNMHKTMVIKLSLNNRPASDLTPLSGLTNMTELNLNDNTWVSDLSSLSGLTGLTTLRLSGTSVSNLSPLANLSNLSRIEGLTLAQIADWTPVDHVDFVNGRPWRP